MNPTDSFSLSSRSTTGRRQVMRRTLGAVIIGGALIGTSACGNGAPTDADRARVADIVTTTIAPSAPSPTAAPSVPSTTGPPAATTTIPTAIPATTTTVAARRPTASRDELVEIDGVRFHVRCDGNGDTTVLLIAGFERADDTWAKVEPDISRRTRVCSYARPGTGSSDPAFSTQTFTTQATQLSALLASIGEPGPYVVVGHSFGGAEAVTFASRYADQVIGLVLIDASPATWPTELCAVVDDGSEMAATIRSTCAGWADPSGNVEHLDVYTSFAEVATLDPLGSLPMTVITAVDRQLADLGTAEVDRLTEAWNQGQQRWSDLSTTSVVVPVEHTSHDIELDRPDVVIDVIVRLLP